MRGIIGLVVVVAIGIFCVRGCSRLEEHSKEVERRISPETATNMRKIVDEAKASGFIMREDGDSVYVDNYWYEMPLDSKKTFVFALHVSRGMRFVMVRNGYNGKVLATASSGITDIKSE
jgi:hypothetical protein